MTIAPVDILMHLLEECEYHCGELPSSGYRWQRVWVADYGTINSPIKFTAAINDEGKVWLSKTSRGTGVNIYDLYDANSIGLLQQELLKIKDRRDRPAGWSPNENHY